VTALVKLGTVRFVTMAIGSVLILTRGDRVLIPRQFADFLPTAGPRFASVGDPRWPTDP